MLFSLAILMLSLVVVIKSANLAIRHSTNLAESFSLPKYVIGFAVVALISILPETFISITSALEGQPSFGLGTLFGSNVADLTLIFALVVFFSGRKLKVQSRLIKSRLWHIAALATPIILGLDGRYSRLDGALLALAGIAFYYFTLKKSLYAAKVDRQKFRLSSVFWLLIGMAGLLLGAHFTVKYGIDLAGRLSISPVLIGMLVVGLGTTLPELFFSVEAARHRHDELALGDILGTVVADATIVVGIMALINPFAFSLQIIYVTGAFMLLSSLGLFYFMKSDKILNQTEAFLLLLIYVVFVLTEFLTNK